MTKEINFLSLSKSETTTASVTTDSSKKEGLSLFDSLMLNSKKDVKTVSLENLDESTKSAVSKNEISKESTSTQEKNLTSTEQKSGTEKVKTTDNESTSKEQVLGKKEVTVDSNTKTQNNLNVEVKTTDAKETSTTSLLDRMVLEANKNAKSVSTQTEDKSTNVKENKTDLSTKIDSTVDKKNITDGKIEVTNNKENSKTKNLENTETKKTDTLEVKDTVNSKISSSVDGEIDIKESSKTNNSVNAETKKIDTLEVKDTTTSKISSTVDDTIKTVTKEDKLSTSSPIEKIVTKDDSLNLDTKDIKKSISLDEDISKSNSNVKIVQENVSQSTTNSQLVNEANLESETSNKINVNADVKLDKTTVKKDLSENANTKTINPEVEAKNVGIVNEQVQSTIDFDGTIEKENVSSDLSKLQKNDTKAELVNNNLNVETKTNTVENESVENVSINKSTTINQENTTTVETKKVDASATVKVSEETLNKSDVKIDNTSNEKIIKDVNLNENIKNQKIENTTTNPKTDNLKTDVTQVQKDSSQDFSKLDEKAFVKNEQRVDLDKNILKETSTTVPKDEVKEETKIVAKSLMDRLFDNAKEQTISVKSGTTVNSSTLTEQTSTLKTNDVATNIFLSSQSNSIYTQMVANKSQGVKIVKDASSVQDVKEGAKILDLGLDETSIEVKKVDKEQVIDNTKRTENKISLIDKLAFDRNMVKEELLSKVLNSSTMAASTASTTSDESVINLNVNQTLATSIQNKIITAQQHMSSMMSDVARNMYENYKPPVTAFRLNLFPAQLGHIAILIKNDKENSLSINMTMSQSSTLDAFVENQNTLRDALNRNFNNGQTNFNLDFNMQEESSSSSFSQGQENANKDNETHSSDEIIESTIQNQDETEDQNYM